jgi:hypothetical protein
VCTAQIAGWVDADTCERVSQLTAELARDSHWWRGPVGWILRDVRPLPAALTISGAQGLWRVPQQVLYTLQTMERRARSA